MASITDSLSKSIAVLTTQEARKYAVLFDIFKYRFPDMNDDAIAWCISIVTGICPHCFENARGCHCWNDE